MQAPAQRQIGLSHILFVCFWTLASLALIIDGLSPNSAPVSRAVTFERGGAITAVQLARQSEGKGFAYVALPDTPRPYGQPAPQANPVTLPALSQPPAPTATPLLASIPPAQAPLHTLRATASNKLAAAPTNPATAVPSTVPPAEPSNSQPTIVAVAAKSSVNRPASVNSHPPAATATPAAPRPPAPTPTRAAIRPPASPTATPQPAAPAPADSGPAADARSGIIAMLAQRQQAVSLLNGDSFIDTVDPQDSALRAEQTVWFDDLHGHPTSYYALELGALALTSSDHAVGTLNERSQLAGQGVRNVSADVVFVQRNGQWYYADLNFETLANDHFRIRFFASNRAVGNALYNASQRTYAQITADLGAAPPGVMEVKLYPSENLLQDSVMLSLPQWVGGWSMPGQSIKTAYNGAPTSSYINLMAHEFTHQVQASLGLNHSNSPDWLNEGLAVYEAELISPDSYEVANRPAILRKARTSNSFFAWASFPPFAQVTGGQVNLAYEQAYSGVQYLQQKYGRARFNAMLGYIVGGNGLDDAFTLAFGVGLAQFDTGWRAWLATKY